jgi:glycosyltransferase involved in cell wall biosynthesis
LIAGRSLRVVIFDRSASSNPYSRGLAGGLEGLGATVVVAGPAQTPDGGVVAVYPRGGVSGQRVGKATDTIVGIARLARLIAIKRPDVVHFQWATSYNYAIARTLKSLTRARLVYTVHVPEPRAGVTRWQHAMVCIADALIVHSSRLRDVLIRRHAVPENRVHVAPHGNYEHAISRHGRAEARQRLGLPAGGPVFAFIGQLVPRKGIETLVEAFRRHCERGMPGILVVAGAAYGIDEEMLRHRLDPYLGRVRWMTRAGQLPAEHLDLVVSAATQVVLPFEETASAVSGSLLFSMTHGRCIVTTDVGENKSTLSGHGLIVPPRDADAVADALEFAVSDPDSCDRIGQDVRAHALDEFGWGRVAALTLRAYAAARQQELQPTHSTPEVADRKVHTSSRYE